MTGNEAVLTWSGTIDETRAVELVQKVGDLIGHVDVLTLTINCIGGSMPAALALHNQLRAMPFTVRTHNVGAVGSAGIPLFLAGAERYACPVSSFLLHQTYQNIPTPGASLMMGAIEMREHLAIVRVSDEWLVDTLVEHCSFESPAEVRDIIRDGEVAYSPEWALRRGLIHGIRPLAMPRNAVAPPKVARRPPPPGRR